MAVVTAVLALMALACNFQEEDTTYSCAYEESKTDGCDGMGFGPYVAECFEFDSEDYNISAQEVCDNVTTPGLYCEAGCCIDYRYQNVSLSHDSCP